MRRLAMILVLAFLLPVDGNGQAKPEDGWIVGKLLVAAPSMPDPRFRQTVIFICEHDQHGAFGLIINRPLGELPGRKVADQFALGVEGSNTPIALHWGGPVEAGRGFVLHSDDYVNDDTGRVKPGFAYSVDLELLRALVTDQGPERAILVLGYAGWGPRQLFSELARDDWLVLPAESDFVFHGERESMWQTAIDSFGVEL
ncbi:MAG TPA: YqgE/AlgH family protein [Alphaproteobacteria bacterium]|nr:YqgE/AlgH family protein [Alphaproteobacteria bacterium]